MHRSSMACFSTGTASFTNNHSLLATVSPSSAGKRPMPSLVPAKPLLVFSCDRRDSYGSLVLKAASLLGPPTRFEASKLKVIFTGEEMERKPLSTIPRAYTLTHCDFTANLTLAVSDNITNDMLREWQTRDDVVAEWKKVKEEMSLHVHCYVSGANPFQELAAEFRYYIFCKELPLVSIKFMPKETLVKVSGSPSMLHGHEYDKTWSLKLWFMEIQLSSVSILRYWKLSYGCISILNQKSTTESNAGDPSRMQLREHSKLDQIMATGILFRKTLGSGRVPGRSYMPSSLSSCEMIA